MNRIRVKLSAAPEVKRIVRAAFPDYRKLEAAVETMGPSGANVNSYWDGGSKAVFVLVDIATLRTLPLPTSSHPFYDIAGRGHGAGENEMLRVDHVGNVTLLQLPPGAALVEAGTSCGKPATATVTVMPESQARMLPYSAPALGNKI